MEQWSTQFIRGRETQLHNKENTRYVCLGTVTRSTNKMLWPFRVPERPTFQHASYYSSNGLWGGGRASQKHFSRPRLHEAETTLPYLINISFFFHRHRGCRAFYHPHRYSVSPRAVNPAINNCARGKVI